MRHDLQPSLTPINHPDLSRLTFCPNKPALPAMALKAGNGHKLRKLSNMKVIPRKLG